MILKGLNCGGKKSKNLQRLEDCKPKFSWTHPMETVKNDLTLVANYFGFAQQFLVKFKLTTN